MAKRYMVKVTYTATKLHPHEEAGTKQIWLCGKDEVGSLVQIDEQGNAIGSAVGVEFYVREHGFKRRHFAEKKAGEYYMCGNLYWNCVGEVVEFEV